jgi:hypothetical protein
MASWFCLKFDQKLTHGWHEAIKHLPVPEWPALVNAKLTGSRKVYHNANYTLGKSILVMMLLIFPR